MTSSSIDSFYQTLDAAWISLTSGAPNLSDLPSALHDSLADVYGRVTQGGTLPPLPEFPSSWAPLPLAPPPPPPPPSSALYRVEVQIRLHPYLGAFLTTSALAGGSYYLFPNQFNRAILRPLTQLLPVAVLPESSRPARVVGPNQAELRKEVVLVLGADGPARELALDLERRGFVVIATVSTPAECDVLERRSRGWIKALVLDPYESSSAAPFLRSLSTALSLRFPLHSSGDPFSRPSHSLALTAVVNCLSLYPDPDGPRPVEALDTTLIHRHLAEKVATVVAVIAGVLPILRTMSSRPGAPEGVILSLVPATTSNVALPFLSLASAADAAILALLDSLRRELAASESSRIKVTVLETGLFDLGSGTAAFPQADAASAPLPVRLDAIYAPALARRRYMVPPAEERRGRKGSHLKKLHKMVFEMIIYGRGGAKTRVGAGALTYRLIGALPTVFVDSALSFHDRLVGFYLAHRPARNPPQQPQHPHHHPTALRPGFAMPASSSTTSHHDQFGAAPTSDDHHPHQQQDDDEGSDAGASSTEDFGVASGMGSFIGVERHEGHH
ncbi:hypothetical protein RQP46_000824 [Phenoliferia psychrophenolica]